MTTLSIDNMRLLDNVDLPDGLDVQITDDAASFMTRKATLNKGSHYWFGTAFRQGKRVQFTTSMPISDYLSVVKIDRAEKGYTVEQLRGASNRPKIESHQKDIKNYLKETACIGEQFIFPAFMLNYGIGWDDESSRGRLTLLVTDEEAIAWPAIFEPPSGKQLPPTDGAHRTSSLKEMIDANKDPQGIDALLGNAVGVTIVMESSKDYAHQDFADCAKAKPISNSVRSTFDVRDIVGRFARELVQTNAFLKDAVDATSPSVNLSSNSARVWSMSAVRGYILAGIPGYDVMSEEEKREVLEDITPLSNYIDACVKHVPVLHDIAGGITPGQIRKQRGGCVLLRGAGWGMLMHARAQALVHDQNPLIMAERLGKVDWFLLKDDASPRPTNVEDSYNWLKTAAQPAWLRMIAFNIERGSYRIKGARENINGAFEQLRSELLAA